MKESIEITLKALEANEAKGERKYVRGRPQNKNARFNYINNDGKVISGCINDISSIGMAVTFDNEMMIQKNTLIKDIQIKIKGTFFNLNGVVIGSRKVGESNTLYVLIFDKSATKEVKQKLKLQIHQFLQDNVNLVLMR